MQNMITLHPSSSPGCVRAPCGHHLRQDVREPGQRPGPAQLEQGHPPRRRRTTLTDELQLLMRLTAV